jgi:plasmid stabilization system protein ParE
MKPEFHPAAEQELAAAVTLGEQRGAGLGGELLAEAERVAELLCEAPSIGEPIDARHRRFPMRRFPFALIYRVDGDVLRIIALSHRRQRPGYWRGRI